MSAGRIDVHHHVLPSVYQDARARLSDSPAIPGVDDVHWEIDEDLAVMDRHGIQAALASITAPGLAFATGDEAAKIARRVNEFLAGLVADHPTRYGAFALIPLPDVSAAIDEVEYALDSLGLDGIGLYTHYRGTYLGDPAFDRLFAVLDERQAVSFIHPVVPPATDQPTFGLPPSLYEFTFDTTRAAVNLAYSGTLDRHPDLQLVLSHAGGTVPYLAQRLTYASTITKAIGSRQPLDLLTSLGRLYYDTAMAANPHTLAGLTSFVETENILFGTDYPFMPESTTAESVAGVVDYFSHDTVHAVERLNALRLFPGLARRLERIPVE
ncbi:MAG: metal-dependent hydrolase [Amycolatopsis sp.]|uniref:amidohydrolase family protein n=1 Tax=Amycolatopsis sp. TaxID=37632 RepID=UPI0026295494|nr:amidohydrolase family protein [Amycolatopsis sp.]MCU1682578.1 metal-dependent hydrolase [Amycolatopsis sp.]